MQLKRVVVTGLGALTPIGNSKDEYWKNLIAGVSGAAAITHFDGSGRLQSVYEHTNPRYYALIKEFDRLTGVPMVLNTSFNENEPVVCKPEEALDTFLRTKMDLLVLENWIIERK